MLQDFKHLGMGTTMGEDLTFVLGKFVSLPWPGAESAFWELVDNVSEVFELDEMKEDDPGLGELTEVGIKMAVLRFLQLFQPMTKRNGFLSTINNDHRTRLCIIFAKIATLRDMSLSPRPSFMMVAPICRSICFLFTLQSILAFQRPVVLSHTQKDSCCIASASTLLSPSLES